MTDRDYPVWRAVALCAFGVAMFSAMDAVMKGLALLLGAYTALLWRCIVASTVMGAAMLATRNRIPPPRAMRLHAIRGCILAPMGLLFFWGLTRLPIAEAIALSFIAPIIALWLSAVLLHEQVHRGSILAAILGMVGVGVILSGRLAGGYDHDALLGAAAVLASAVLFALNLIVQRRQAQQANVVEISFFQNFIVLLLLLPLMPWLLERGVAIDWPLVIAAAGLTVCSQMALSRAYAHAPASRLIPIEYSAFAWASLFGWLAFGEKLTPEVVVGVVLIVVACLITARQRPDIAAHVEIDAA